MNIGYLRLDHGEWTQGAYNSQEIGLAKAFVELGHTVTIFYCVHPDDSSIGTEIKIEDGIKKCYLPAKRIGHHAILNMKELNRYPIDLLHIQGDNLLKVPDAVRYCKRRKIKYYCYVGRIDSEKNGRMHKLITNMMVKRNTNAYKKSIVFGKTPAIKKELKNYGVKDVIVAPVGLDVSIIPKISESRKQLREGLKLPVEKTIILCVCSLRTGKRPYDIFELVKKLDGSYYIVFIGGWDRKAEAAFQSKIIDSRSINSFRYINRVSNVEIHKYYKAVDFLVNFNPHEIFGMAILEAMYQGVTVVARKAPGPEYIIENGKSGYLVESIDEMAKIIKHGEKISQASYKRVVENFVWSKSASIILKRIYEE